MEKKISLKADSLTVEEVIEKLVEQNNLYFSYNPNILPVTRHNYLFENVRLDSLLKQILPEKNYFVKNINDQLIILKIEPSPVKITGKVIDEHDKNPVPFASVLIDGETIGTMTNIDGTFDLTVPFRFIDKQIVIRSIGYEKKGYSVQDLKNLSSVFLKSVSINMREVKVKPRDPLVILQEFRNHLSQNYEDQSQLMVTFYRETARQDGDFIGVWEAVLEVLKRSYQNNDFDRVRFLKGRKSLFYQYKHNVKLKMQGGPVYINTLDVVKTMESFLSPEFEYQYQYRFEQPEVMNGKVVWVLHFSRREGTEIPCFNGKLLIDADSYALIRADFAYDKKSLKSIGSTFIQKEPIGYRTLPENCEYSVQYRQIGEKWYFYSAHCDVLFRVTQKKKDKTVYRNVTDILVTQQYPYPKKARFGPEGIVRTDDIFSEIIGSYDPEFWENYNVIKPEEELTNAIRQAGK